MNLGPKDRREGSLFYLLVAFFCRVTYRSLMMLFRFHRSEAAMVLAGCLLGTTQAGWATPPRGAAEIFAEHERGVNSPCGEILFVKKLAAELPALDAPTAQQLREMIERHFEKHLRQLPLWIAEALANDQDPELRDAAFAALETTAKIPGNKLLERVVQVLNQLPPKIAEVATQRLKNNFSSQHLSFLWPLSSKHRHLVSADLWKQWRVADQLVHGSSGAATQKYVAPNDILTHLEQILTLPIDSPEFSSASELSLAKIEELFQTARDVGLAGMFVDRARVLYSSREEVVRRLNYLYLQSSAIDRPLDLDFIPRSHEFSEAFKDLLNKNLEAGSGGLVTEESLGLREFFPNDDLVSRIERRKRYERFNRYGITDRKIVDPLWNPGILDIDAGIMLAGAAAWIRNPPFEFALYWSGEIKVRVVPKEDRSHFYDESPYKDHYVTGATIGEREKWLKSAASYIDRLLREGARKWSAEGIGLKSEKKADLVRIELQVIRGNIRKVLLGAFYLTRSGGKKGPATHRLDEEQASALWIEFLAALERDLNASPLPVPEGFPMARFLMGSKHLPEAATDIRDRYVDIQKFLGPKASAEVLEIIANAISPER